MIARRPADSSNIIAHLAALPVTTSGPCSTVLKFKDIITADEWSPTALGRIQHKVIRNDGAVTPIQTISFPVEGGLRPVSTTWTLGEKYHGQ
jgi:hypothetical protein